MLPFLAMAIYTQAEYDSLKSAYLALVGGETVVQASISGKFIRYREAQLPHIRLVLAEMERELGLRVSRAYAKQVSRFE
jgi:hypothetical protein